MSDDVNTTFKCRWSALHDFNQVSISLAHLTADQRATRLACFDRLLALCRESAYSDTTFFNAMHLFDRCVERDEARFVEETLLAALHLQSIVTECSPLTRSECIQVLHEQCVYAPDVYDGVDINAQRVSFQRACACVLMVNDAKVVCTSTFGDVLQFAADFLGCVKARWLHKVRYVCMKGEIGVIVAARVEQCVALLKFLSLFLLRNWPDLCSLIYTPTAWVNVLLLVAVSRTWRAPDDVSSEAKSMLRALWRQTKVAQTSAVLTAASQLFADASAFVRSAQSDVLSDLYRSMLQNDFAMSLGTRRSERNMSQHCFARWLQWLDEGCAPRVAMLADCESICSQNLAEIEREFGADAAEVVGRGTYGTVLRVGDVVCKRFAVDELAAKEEFDWAIAVGVLREVSLLRALGHPHILKPTNLYFDDQLDCIMMLSPYYGGGTLEDMTIDPSTNGVRYAQQMLAAVLYLHDHEVVHRDIKPANFVLSSDLDTVVLIDFSLAARTNAIDCSKDGGWRRRCQMAQNDRQTDAVCFTCDVCTLWYRAPELLKFTARDEQEHEDAGDDEEYTSTPHAYIAPAVDFWALGCVLCEMCLPLPTDETGERAIFSTDGPHSSAQTLDFIHKMLADEQQFSAAMRKTFDDCSYLCDLTAACFRLEPDERVAGVRRFREAHDAPRGRDVAFLR